MPTQNGTSTPYRPVPAAGVGNSVFGWLRGLFGTTPAYKVPPAVQPAPVAPEPPSEPSPVQGDSDCVQGPVTIVISARD